MLDTLQNTPRWFYEAYPGDEEDMAKDILDAVRAKLIISLQQDGKPIDMQDAELQARIEHEALMTAAAHSDTITDTSQRAFVKMVWKIYHDQSHRFGKDEYDTVQEFLVDRIPRLKDKSGELSDIMFLLEHFLPLLEQLGKDWTPEKMLRFREKWSKTRASLPTMRHLVRQFNDTVDVVVKEIEQKETDIKRLNRILQSEPSTETPEYKQALVAVQQISKELPKVKQKLEKVTDKAGETFQTGVEAILVVIDNPKIPTWGQGGVSETLKGVQPVTTSTFDGYKALAPNNEVFFMIKVPERYSMLVETALKTIIDFKISDPILFYKEFRGKFFPHDVIEDDIDL